MGQTISKKLIPRNLSKAIDSFESRMTKDALDDIARKKSHARATGAKYTDPNAQEGGFKRDSWGEGKGEGMAQESRQRDFLNDGDGGKNMPQEMPKDLLNFLNAAGPLERKVDKSMTSPKVYESLLEVEEEERQKKQQAGQRTRRNMLMVEQQQQEEGGGEIDMESDNMKAGLTTTRTTSFSTATPEEDNTELKLTDGELFQFLIQVGQKELTPEEYLQRRFAIEPDKSDENDGGGNRGNKKDDASDTTLPRITEEEMQQNLKLLQDMCKYNGIPVLMQDTDDTMIGAWNYNTEDLERQQIQLATNSARLTIEGEFEEKALSVKGGGEGQKLAIN